MLVVADTSPLHVLASIELVDVLPELFGQVLVPIGVLNELAKSPLDMVRKMAAIPPVWLVVRDPERIQPIPGIDPGEEAAINLAQEVHADLLLIDDLAGRKAATSRGLAVIGTLAVLERGA